MRNCNDLVLTLGLCLAFSAGTTVFAGEDKPGDAPPKKADSAADEATSKKNFATDYEAGCAALTARNWNLVRQKMTSALKALGDFNDQRKSTAQVLQNKAERALIKDDAMYTAGELIRLKQWVEAEEAYRKVVDVFGETDTLRKKVLACREGLEGENEGLKKAGELLKEKKYKEAIELYHKASDALGGVRMIRDGLTAAQLGSESDELLKKAPDLLVSKKWDDAFNAYKRLSQIVGETDEVVKGIEAARAGYAEDKKSVPVPEKSITDKPAPSVKP